MVILGTPTPASSKLYAITVTEGDPTGAGPLAGAALNLPVYHITEAEIKSQIDESVYDAEVGLAEMTLDTEDIKAAVAEVRNNGGV